jgi:hypothetical protein
MYPLQTACIPPGVRVSQVENRSSKSIKIKNKIFSITAVLCQTVEKFLFSNLSESNLFEKTKHFMYTLEWLVHPQGPVL